MRMNGRHWFGTMVWLPSDARRTKAVKGKQIESTVRIRKWSLFYFPALANTPGLEFKKGPPRDAETQRQSDTKTPTHNGTET